MKEVTETTRHASVLLLPALELLRLAEGMTAVDATLGGGGHTREMLRRVGQTGKVVAIDTDTEALGRVRALAETDEVLGKALRDGRLILVHGNYSELADLLSQEGIGKVDAILADLGFSSDQIEESARGMSFLREGPLDMRLDQSQGESAAELLERLSEAELAKILREYGEEDEAGRIARAIVQSRKEHPVRTTTELASIIESAYPKEKRRRLGIHPATKAFQALRIAVNRELEHLETFLAAAEDVLEAGGRIAVIAFHSGEDRIVKHAFQEAARGCTCPKGFPICVCKRQPRMSILTKKPVVPDEAETAGNPRARSAKLRGAEKI